MHRIGIDVGGTKILIGLFTSDGFELVDSERIDVMGISDFGGCIASAIEVLLSRNSVLTSELEAIGVGIPGTVSADGRKVLKAPNVPGLPGDIADLLEKRVGVPVRLIQDSRAAAYGEYLAFGKSSSALVCVTLGTGIGTGIVLDGKIYSGALGAAGELGHLPIIEGGRKCGCGKQGCLEKYAAGGGLDITSRELYGNGATAKELFERAESGDAEAKNAINNAVVMLGRALCAIVNLLSVDRLVFSGGLSARREQYLFPIIDYIRTHCYSTGRLPEISEAALGEYSGLYGAAYVGV